MASDLQLQWQTAKPKLPLCQAQLVPPYLLSFYCNVGSRRVEQMVPPVVGELLSRVMPHLGQEEAGSQIWPTSFKCSQVIKNLKTRKKLSTTHQILKCAFSLSPPI